MTQNLRLHKPPHLCYLGNSAYDLASRMPAPDQNNRKPSVLQWSKSAGSSLWKVEQADRSSAPSKKLDRLIWDCINANLWLWSMPDRATATDRRCVMV